MKCLVFLLLCLHLVKSQQNLEFLQDFDTWKNYVYKNLNDTRVSEDCSKQLSELETNSKDTLWKFFDATSKFPWSGLSVATTSDLGNYDECMNINYEYSGGNIKGKHCMYSILLPINITEFNINPYDFNNFYQLSVCIPNTCTPEDFNALLNVSLFINTPCHTRDDLTVTNGDIAMIKFLIVIFTIMAISTWYDVNLKRQQKKSGHPIYLAFSIYTNVRNILKTSKNHTEQIQIFNGMRTISIAWVIAGHAIASWIKTPVTNSDVLPRIQKDIKLFYVAQAPFAVDTFFYISGFLLAFIYMKQKSKPLVLQIKSFPSLIIYRYIRLTPAVAVLFFFLLTIFKFFGDGPLWIEGVKYMTEPCHKHYLSFFTYTQNYVNYDDLCLLHTWYLSADMQLFIFGTIFLIILSVILAKDAKNFKLVMIICLMTNIFFIILPLVTELTWKNYGNAYDTHSRVIDYTLGIMMGIFLRETKDKPFLFNKFSKNEMINIIVWLIVLPIMGGCLVLNQELTYSGNYSQESQITFSCFYRPIWCVGLSWIVYASYYGYGGIVSWILSRPILQVTSKLSYSMYLVHFLVIFHPAAIVRTRLYFSEWICFFNWCAMFTICIIISFIWVLAFESPLITIEKQIFGRGTSKDNNTSAPDNTTSRKTIA